MSHPQDDDVLLDVLRPAVVRLAGGSELAYGSPAARRGVVSVMVVVLKERSHDLDGVFRYLRLMQVLAGNLRIAILTDESGCFVRGGADGWLVEHLPLGSEMTEGDLSHAVRRRSETVRAQVLLVPAVSGVDRSLHYRFCAELGVRVRWRAVAPAQPPVGDAARGNYA